MSAKSNNPAGRLFNILFEARRLNQATKAREAWAQLFDVESTDTAAILQIVADLILLTADAKEAVEALDDVDHVIYLKPFARIEQVFATANLETNWKSVRDRLDEPTMVGLQFCADTLSRLHQEAVVEQEELDSLLALVDEAFREVMASSLSAELKKVIMQSLEEIRRAVRTYQIWGLDGLKRALATGVGGIFLNKDDFERNKKQSSVKRFLSALGKLNQVVILALNTQDLLGPALQTLLPPSS